MPIDPTATGGITEARLGSSEIPVSSMSFHSIPVFHCTIPFQVFAAVVVAAAAAAAMPDQAADIPHKLIPHGSLQVSEMS